MRGQFIASLTAAVMFTAIAGCARGEQKQVIVIEKTKTYHRDGCPPVHMARTTAMPLTQAQAHKFRACPLCTPDRL